MSARALVGSESTCVTILEAKLHLVDPRPQRTLARPRLPRCLRCRRPCARVLEHGRSASRGSTTWRSTSWSQGPPRDVPSSPTAPAGCSSSSAGDRDEAGGQAQHLVEALGAGDGPPSEGFRAPRSSPTRRRRPGSGRSASRASGRPLTSPASRIPGPAGKTPPSPPTASATTSATCGSCGTPTTTARTVRPLRAGLPPLPHRFRSHHERGNRALAALHARRRGARRPARRVALG